MLKHGRAGVPMEVMGLMLGEFVDDYTVRVIDVFAMPQSGTVCTSSISTSCSTMENHYRNYGKLKKHYRKYCSLLNNFT